MTNPIASLSLDLDNKWSYLKTHGDRGWESYPSYLEVVVPRFLEMFSDLGLRATVFIVGQDAALAKNRSVLKSIVEEEHEIGNHSFHHEPWLHKYSNEELDKELTAAEDAIYEATGIVPKGFRGPGYSLSPAVLNHLAARGYQYDASTLPSFLGPLARAYYFLGASLNSQQRDERKRLFGGWREGLRPLGPYWWECETKSGPRKLLEIPITTVPFLRAPFHLSYVLFLRQFSAALAWAYWRMAIAMCRLTNIAPSILLHPLDFLGGDDEPDLAFFPAMQMRGDEKLDFVGDVLMDFAQQFHVLPLEDYAAVIARQGQLATHRWPEPSRRLAPGTTPSAPALLPESSRF